MSNLGIVSYTKTSLMLLFVVFLFVYSYFYIKHDYTYTYMSHIDFSIHIFLIIHITQPEQHTNGK